MGVKIPVLCVIAPYKLIRSSDCGCRTTQTMDSIPWDVFSLLSSAGLVWKRPLPCPSSVTDQIWNKEKFSGYNYLAMVLQDMKQYFAQNRSPINQTHRESTPKSNSCEKSRGHQGLLSLFF